MKSLLTNTLDARSRASNAATEQEQARLKIKHLEKRIAEEEPRAKQAKQQNSTSLKDLEGLRTQAKRLQAELEKLGFEEGGSSGDLYKEEAAIQQRIRELEREADTLKRQVSQIDFDYSDPTPGFDRSKVKGLVAQLFSLSEDKAEAGTALEICAGGRLYNVVVDTEVTGSQLLEKGKLKKRVTIIPLNKITASRAPAQKVATAQRLAPGKVHLALSLIGYERDIEIAMEYVFGSTLICTDPDTAKLVTFDPSVRLASVTIEGDQYYPGGTLTGGSAPSSSGVLVTMGKLNAIMRQLDEERATLAELQARIVREKKKLDQARQLKQQLDLKNHEISLTEEQINSNSASAIILALEEMKESIKQHKQTILDAKARQTAAEKEVKTIERDINDFKNNKGDKLAELQKTVDAMKKTLAKQATAMKATQKDFQTAQLDAEQADTDLASAKEELADIATSLTTASEEITSLTTQQFEIKSVHAKLSTKLSSEIAKLSAFDAEISAVQDAITSKTNQITEDSLTLQKLAHEIEKSTAAQTAAKQSVTHLESTHDWIEGEKDHFGKPSTPYDHEGVNIAECKASLKNLTERSQGLKKKINPKVMNMIDSVEKKEVSLKQMLRTVNRDKRKIEETISSLDEYKREALLKTWQKVTTDFGNIFAELLPGSFAKLVPPEGKEISSGLEVKVQLGKVWKQSLTELSGGQRSLIALSLILALLQFKPAPMYILDEVDAALDLSHTQNIGRLIRTRFKGSQFIVVSLKDGMFQNANKVFRTRFQDGTSVVSVEKGVR